jgi:hypothetical protein
VNPHPEIKEVRERKEVTREKDIDIKHPRKIVTLNHQKGECACLTELQKRLYVLLE